MPGDYDDHALALLRLAWRLDALEQWRKDIDMQVAGNRRELERLVKADEIAEAVAQKMNSTHTLQLTKVQRRWAIAAAAAAAGGGILGAAHTIVQLFHGGLV